MSAMTIRMLRPSDAEAMCAMMSGKSVVWGTLQLPLNTPENWRKKLEGNDPNWNYQLAAELDGKVVGSAGLHRNNRPRTLHSADLGITVHDDYQGRGIGRALMAALVDAGDNWLNLVRIELSVWVDNDRAIKLYEQFGFEREGVLKKHAFREGKYVDSLVMGRIRPDMR